MALREEARTMLGGGGGRRAHGREAAKEEGRKPIEVSES